MTAAATDGDNDALAKRLREKWRTPLFARSERVARFFNDSDTAAFTLSQWKARDRDDVRFLCEDGDYFEVTMKVARFGFPLPGRAYALCTRLDLPEDVVA